MARKRSDAPASLGPPLFLVQRLAWSVGMMPTSRIVEYQHQEEDGGVPIAVFSVRDRAEALARELTTQAQGELSPFLFMYSGELDGISSRSRSEWYAALKAVGLQPPTRKAFDNGYGEINWQGWYDSLIDDLTDEQRRTLWGLCDRLKLYEVVPIDPPG
jgi:hypothetical protein